VRVVLRGRDGVGRIGLGGNCDTSTCSNGKDSDDKGAKRSHVSSE
jgi:hypothetical protein